MTDLPWRLVVAVFGPILVANNPWHAERVKAPRGRLRLQFVLMGLVIGAVFGAAVAGIAWWIARP